MKHDTTLTLEQIETAITGYPCSPYYARQNLVVPNCTWGFLNHEADLLVVNRTKRLIEVEIKRTWSDFMADFKKKHTHDDKHLAYLYYAVPLSIAERVFHWLYEGTYKCKPGGASWATYSDVTGYTEHNPHHCGLIIYASPEEAPIYYKNQVGSCGINVFAKRMIEYKVTQDDELKLLRLLGLRVWGMKKKLAEYQAEPSLFKDFV